MPDSLPRMPPKGPLTTERRQNPRHPVRPTEYIEIGDSNGGIILDISESGMAVASAQALVGHQTLRFRFQLPRSLETIETSGEINWIGETKKRAGVRFVDLPVAAREQIHKWIDSQTSGHSNGDQKPNGSSVSSSSTPIHRASPRHEPIRHEFADEENEIPDEQTSFAKNPNPSKNLNPFSSILSSPLDEPETEESELEDEEKTTGDSNGQSLSGKRAQARFPMTASTYVQLSDGNGGLMANLSRTGFCVRAAKTFESDHLPVVRFQLPNAHDFVEASAWIVWKSASKKTAGARFENLTAEAQSQIAQWIDAQPLPKNAPIKNPHAKNLSALNAPATNRVEHREKVPPSPRTPAPVTPVPVTLMASDSVPIPSYISPLAISLDAQPATPSAINPSSTPLPSPLAPSLSKVPPVVSANKSSSPSTEKTLAQVPAIIPPSSSAKPVTVTPAAVPPQSQKPLSAPMPLPQVASSNATPNLASPATPRVILPPSPKLPGEPLPIRPLPDTSRGLKNIRGQLAASSTPAAPFLPATLVGPPILNQPDWSVAPKRPTGYWKIAAMIVVIVGTLLGAATLLRSKKSVTPASQETTQNASIAASEPTVTPSNDPAPNSAPTNQSSAASASNSGSSHELYDAPRNTVSSKSPAKGDDQFVDEPRPARSQSQVSSPSIESDSPSSRADSGQPSSSASAANENGSERNQDQPTEQQNSASLVTDRREQTRPVPTPVFSNANGEAASAPDFSSPTPASAASRNQQPDPNLAAAGVTQNSSANEHPAATSENASSPRTAPASISPSSAATNSAVTTSSPAAASPVPSVSVFSRFRAIRTASDAARPAGSDLQIGRLKSGPAPPYPVEAQRQQIQGTVELEVLVGADGNILTVHLVKGPPELASVAMGTVRSWQYGQTTLGGHPVETDQSIYFTFKLTK